MSFADDVPSRVAARAIVERTWALQDEPYLISGDDVMSEFDLKPGPMVGEVLVAAYEMQREKGIRNRDQLLVAMRHKLKDKLGGGKSQN